MKKFISGFVLGAFLFSIIPIYAVTQQTITVSYKDIKMSVNGEILPTDSEPFIYNNRTFVPVRFVAEALGMEVKYNETTDTVEIDDIAPILKTQEVDSMVTILSVTATSDTTVDIIFDTAVDKASAENPSNYSIATRYGKKTILPVSLATLDSTGTKVILTTSKQTSELIYSLEVKGIVDSNGISSGAYSSTFVGKPSETTSLPENVSEENKPKISDVKFGDDIVDSNE